MCGYCIEGGVLLDFIERELTGEPQALDNNFLPNYLQETMHLPEVLKQTQDFANFPWSLKAALCRAWDDWVTAGRGDTAASVEQAYGERAVAAFLDALEGEPGNRVQALIKRLDYRDPSAWDPVTSHPGSLLDDAESTLRGYRDGWLLGQAKEFSDPAARLRKTGSMDPLADTTPAGCRRFDASFPVVFFAFLVLAKHGNRSALLQDLALIPLPAVPSFEGYDLWLQRKAFITCLSTYGIPFVLDNFERIRYELLYYAILRQAIRKDDYPALSERLAAAGYEVILGVDADSLLQLMARWGKSHAGTAL